MGPQLPLGNTAKRWSYSFLSHCPGWSRLKQAKGFAGDRLSSKSTPHLSDQEYSGHRSLIWKTGTQRSPHLLKSPPEMCCNPQVRPSQEKVGPQLRGPCTVGHPRSIPSQGPRKACTDSGTHGLCGWKPRNRLHGNARLEGPPKQALLDWDCECEVVETDQHGLPIESILGLHHGLLSDSLSGICAASSPALPRQDLAATHHNRTLTG